LETNTEEKTQQIVLKNVVKATKFALSAETVSKMFIIDIMIKLNKGLLNIEKIKETLKSYLDDVIMPVIKELQEYLDTGNLQLNEIEEYWKRNYEDQYGKWDSLETKKIENFKIPNIINSELFRQHDEIECPHINHTKINNKVFDKFCEEFISKIEEIKKTKKNDKNVIKKKNYYTK